jgi:endonuclease YncB( thermonuclease family)
MSVDNATFSNCKPFVPKITSGKVVKVYDGDSITVASFLHDDVYRFSIRISGIDCPEITSKIDNKVACIVRDELSTVLLNKVVELNVHGNDKYGRLLADVSVGNTDIGKWLVAKRYAVPYSGRTKKSPPNWEEYIQPRGWRRWFRVRRMY